MNLTQAQVLVSDLACPTASTTCQRCDRPTTTLFNWRIVEALCASCFIEALYHHNDDFPRFLQRVSTREELLALCQEYQSQGLYFPAGPDDFPPGCEDRPVKPAYQTRGGTTTMNTAQHALPIPEWKQHVPRPVMIRELPESERPVNRLNHYGAGSVSNSELIAAILQTPNALHQANCLLARHKGLIGLARANTHELQELKGLGPAKVAQIKAAMELGRRLLVASPDEKPKIKSPADAANLVMLEMMSLEQEHMRLILLDSKNQVIDTPTMYVGSLNTSLIRVGELFREAIRQNAAAMIIVHNHPSGDARPSPEDIAVTELINQAGELLDIQVLDHLIIGQQRYVSLKERNLGFK
jgi:DNA repair protein RadC